MSIRHKYFHKGIPMEPLEEENLEQELFSAYLDNQ